MRAHTRTRTHFLNLARPVHTLALVVDVMLPAIVEPSACITAVHKGLAILTIIESLWKTLLFVLHPAVQFDANSASTTAPGKSIAALLWSLEAAVYMRAIGIDAPASTTFSCRACDGPTGCCFFGRSQVDDRAIVLFLQRDTNETIKELKERLDLTATAGKAFKVTVLPHHAVHLSEHDAFVLDKVLLPKLLHWPALKEAQLIVVLPIE